MSEAGESLSEIDRLMRESRDRQHSGWPIPLCWGLLTLAALAASWWIARTKAPGHAKALIWATHNLLGWAFTFYWKGRERAATGRDSLKGQGVGKIWAMYTLAMWLTMWEAHGVSVALLCTLNGLALLSTGVVLESLAPQVLGVSLAVFGTAFPALAPSMGVAGDLIAMPVAMLLWAVLSRKARA